MDSIKNLKIGESTILGSDENLDKLIENSRVDFPNYPESTFTPDTLFSFYIEEFGNTNKKSFLLKATKFLPYIKDKRYMKMPAQPCFRAEPLDKKGNAKPTSNKKLLSVATTLSGVHAYTRAQNTVQDTDWIIYEITFPRDAFIINLSHVGKEKEAIIDGTKAKFKVLKKISDWKN